MALDSVQAGCNGNTRLRLIFFTCAHQADYIHKDDKPEERVDGRYALNHLWQLQLRAKEMEEADGIATRIVCLGDMSTKNSPDAWQALQAVNDRGIISLVGNHDAYNFPCRHILEKAMDSPAFSHATQMNGVAQINLNPFFNRDVELVPEANTLIDKDGVQSDWADTYRDTTKIIRNYIPVEHAEAIYSWLTEKVETGEVTKKGKPKTTARKNTLEAWSIAAHNKPESKMKFETANEAGDKILRTERIKGPKKLLCRFPKDSPPKNAVATDDNGYFEMVHMDEVIKQVSKIMGKDKVSIGEFYGDQHPTTFKYKDGHVILPAFSSAQPEEVPQGFFMEVLYDQGSVTKTEHVMPYDEQSAKQARNVLEATVEEDVHEDKLELV